MSTQTTESHPSNAAGATCITIIQQQKVLAVEVAFSPEPWPSARRHGMTSVRTTPRPRQVAEVAAHGRLRAAALLGEQPARQPLVPAQRLPQRRRHERLARRAGALDDGEVEARGARHAAEHRAVAHAAEEAHHCRFFLYPGV